MKHSITLLLTQIDEQGEEKSSSADNFGALSMGRVGIVMQGAVACKLAAAISVRYSAARRQFGPDEQSEEWPVLEYPLQVRAAIA